MFLELNVSLKVEIPDALNERLEQGEDAAFLELERSMIRAMEAGGMKVPVLEIQAAGPHNTEFNENRPAKGACSSPCVDNYCPIHGINATRKA